MTADRVTQEAIDELVALEKQATSAPWDVDVDYERASGVPYIHDTQGHALMRDDEAELVDLEYVAKLRTATPALLAEVVESRAELARHRAAVPADVAGLVNELRGIASRSAPGVPHWTLAADTIILLSAARDRLRECVGKREAAELAALRELDEVRAKVESQAREIAELEHSRATWEKLAAVSQGEFALQTTLHAEALRLEVAKRAVLGGAARDACLAVGQDSTLSLEKQQGAMRCVLAVERLYAPGATSLDPAARILLDRLAALEAVAKATVASVALWDDAARLRRHSDELKSALAKLASTNKAKT